MTEPNIPLIALLLATGAVTSVCIGHAIACWQIALAHATGPLDWLITALLTLIAVMPVLMMGGLAVAICS